MNLFWKKIFGTLQNTTKFEAKYKQLYDQAIRYENVAKSQELIEYKALYDLVKSASFKEKKDKLHNRKYKDTEYHRDSVKFEKLSHDSKLQEFLEISKSAQLKEFIAFEQTPEFEDLGDPKKVEANPTLKKFKDFHHSKEYKIYSRFKDSFILKEYLTLKETVSTEEFKVNNAFWANKNRWETTEESKQEQRYFALCDNPDIQFYNKSKAEQFSQFLGYERILNEDFKWNTLNTSTWEHGYFKDNSALISSYSYSNQQQAYVEGANTRVNNGILQIQTKEEAISSRAWDEKQGFRTQDFQYTSDVINGHNTVYIKNGIFRAKIRTLGNKEVRHRFFLSSTEQSPIITIFKSHGSCLRFGVRWQENGQFKESKGEVTGLNPKDFYIYSLIWTEKELIWEINNMEIFRTSAYNPKVPLFPMINSFIPKETKKQKATKAGAATMEVDWIQVFQKKKA